MDAFFSLVASLGNAVSSFCYHGKPSAFKDLVVPTNVGSDAETLCSNVCYPLLLLGKPFKKATSFLAVHLVLSRLENAVCHASKRGLCQFSQCPHLQLCGKDESGQWRTRMAQPYPVKMCNAIAKCFHDAEVERIASRFQSKLA